MKLAVEQSTLARLSTTAQRFASSMSGTPFAGVLIEAKDGKLNLYASDMASSIKVSSPEVEIMEEGSAVTDARFFSNLVSKLTGQLILEEDREKNNLKMKYGRSSCRLNLLQQEGVLSHFKNLEQPFEGKFFMQAGQLKNALQNVAFACAKDHYQKVFTGVLFDIRPNEIRFVASDTARLAWYTIDAIEEEKKPAEFRTIVPGKTINELIRILKNSEDDVEIGAYNNNIVFTAEDFMLMSTMVDGEFPNYEKVIPQTNSYIELKTSLLQPTIERLKLLNQQAEKIKSPHAVFSINGKGEISVSSTSEITGELSEITPLENSSGFEEEFKIAFNPRLLSDILEFIGEKTRIDFSDETHPALITGEENPNVRHIIVPMLLTN